MRVEKDSLGEVRVPDGAFYGAQTQRAIENFPVSGRRMPRAFIAALAQVKGACAEANAGPHRESIQEACERIAAGAFDDQFPVDVFQTGSGTSTNMNMNEVIANLCNPEAGTYAPVHPNDHVNQSQSSNDVIPTAAHVAALAEIRGGLKAALDRLASALQAKAKEFDALVKIGRTHLMDAVPVRLGQEFGGYAAQVRKAWEHVDATSKGLEELAIGGTATGTGLNAPRGFGCKVADLLARRLGLPFREARNHFEAQGARDDLVRVSGALRALAVALAKIANDVRLMGSGPFGGLAELRIPDLQPGSSIMPGKVNPVMCEMVVQVAAQVVGNDAAVATAGAGGHFELNAMIPVMAANLLDSIALLTNAARLFAERCVDGLRANPAALAVPLEKSPIAATVLGPVLGYDKASDLVKDALAQNRSVKALAVERGLLSQADADRLFNFREMTGQ
ncbi:MAG TPA: class II fumarate hydratase [Planctomycetota bacterium]